MTTSPPPAVEEALCRACGMCCDGTLFEVGRIEEGDDVGALSRAGLKFVDREGRPMFEQPCVCFRGGACAVYQQRPVRCQQFRCRVLQDVSSGQLSSEEAHLRITRALKWRRALVEHLGDRFGGSAQGLSARWRIFRSSDPDEDTDVLFGGFLALLRRQFRPSSDGAS